MAKFRVRLVRELIQRGSIVVDAKNKDEAMDIACEYEFEEEGDDLLDIQAEGAELVDDNEEAVNKEEEQ